MIQCHDGPYFLSMISFTVLAIAWEGRHVGQSPARGGLCRTAAVEPRSFFTQNPMPLLCSLCSHR